MPCQDTLCCLCSLGPPLLADAVTAAGTAVRGWGSRAGTLGRSRCMGGLAAILCSEEGRVVDFLHGPLQQLPGLAGPLPCGGARAASPASSWHPPQHRCPYSTTPPVSMTTPASAVPAPVASFLGPAFCLPEQLERHVPSPQAVPPPLERSRVVSTQVTASSAYYRPSNSSAAGPRRPVCLQSWQRWPSWGRPSARSTRWACACSSWAWCSSTTASTRRSRAARPTSAWRPSPLPTAWAWGRWSALPAPWGHPPWAPPAAASRSTPSPPDTEPPDPPCCQASSSVCLPVCLAQVLGVSLGASSSSQPVNPLTPRHRAAWTHMLTGQLPKSRGSLWVLLAAASRSTPHPQTQSLLIPLHAFRPFALVLGGLACF